MDWPQRVISRYEFPGLIRRLILRDNDQVVRSEMRDAEGAGVEGYDGIIDALRATPFVPRGRSLWELGVSNDFRAKANKDFRKRTLDPLGENPPECTFVFVTPHRWEDKEDWSARKKESSNWADVRVYDVDNIMQVLEDSPAVHIWLSELLDKPANSAQSLDRWWSRFSTRTSPALSFSTVLAGRADSSQQLLNLFEEDRRLTTISAKSVDDTLAFVAATILSTQEDISTDLLARCLIVHDPAALRRFDSSGDLLLLLPYREEVLRDAEQATSHVILLCADNTPADLKLPPVDIEQVESLLQAEGVQSTFARRLARAAGTSVRSFQRVASQRPPIGSEWRSVLSDASLRRAWLLGSWTTSRSGDLDAFGVVVNHSFEEVEEELRTAVRESDPIFSNVGSVWAVVNPEEQIELSELQLIRSDFVGLERAVQNVLASVDPALDLPPERRWQAAILGRSRLHSRELRRGLAVTLALLGARGTNIDLGDGLTATGWATGMVNALFNRANNDESIQLWSSLSDVLPLLAEAGPDQFLNALASAVRMSEFAAQIFLDDQGSSFTTSSPHTGVLWALEVAAWDRQTFGRAVDLLAQLDEIDQGGRLQNRPLNSLLSIFRLHTPQTLASTQERFQVLDALVQRHPDVGIQLLIKLLPGTSELILDTVRPRFRLEIEGEDTDLPEYVKRIGMIVDRVLAKLSQDASLWPSVIPRLGDFPPDERSKVLDSIATADNLTESNGDELWRAGSDLLRQHREYSDAPWALPEQELNRLEGAIARLAPESPSISNRWLFDEMYPGIRVVDIPSAEESLRQMRTESLQLIAEAQGLDGINNFCQKVKIPALVGYSLPDADIIEDLSVARLFDDQRDGVVAMVGGYFRRRAETDPDLLIGLVDELSDRPLIQARLLSHVPQLTTAWAKVAQSDVQVQEVYWQEFRIVGRGLDFALTNEAARHLLDNGQPGKALDLINIYLHGNEDARPEPQYVAEALEALLASRTNSYRILPYQVESSIAYLRAADFDETRTAQLEWSFLPMLGKEAADGLLLERKLATDPQFFVQIISYAYKRASDETEDADGVAPQIATNAHELLRMWKRVPGSTGRGETIDATALGQWYEGVVPLLQQADRYRVGLRVIGQTLAFAPEDSDGSWPCTTVRDFIEAVGNDKLDQGFHIGCFNKRGATWRSLREGGAQEHALGEKYRGLSERIVTTHPRVASILRSLAETYLADGRREDAEAQRRRQGIE